MFDVVKMWRQSVAGVVVTALVVVPGAATACAALCVESAGPHASATSAAAAHAHHTAVATEHRPHVGFSVGAASTHDCRDHGGAIHRLVRRPRSARAGSAVDAARAPSLQFQPPAGEVMSRHTRSTHGPPDTSGPLRPLVLRI